MTKEQIGKEIKELIRSIKTHYTFVEEEDRIPLIELELITSKIRKLYEKSIINNYLHSNDEAYMSQEKSRRLNERKNFERNSIEAEVKSKIAEKELIVETVSKTEPMVPEPITAVVESIQVQSAIEEPKAPEIIAHKSSKVLKDLKLLIGINDKFLLINNLFARNDQEYKSSIEHLSSLNSLEDASNYMNFLAKKYSWNTESYAFVRLLQILEKRYK